MLRTTILVGTVPPVITQRLRATMNDLVSSPVLEDLFVPLTPHGGRVVMTDTRKTPVAKRRW
jgi:hypothetical protein